MCKAHSDINLTGCQTCHRGSVGIGLHNIVQIADGFAVIGLQPQAGVNVSGGGGGTHHSPSSAVQIFPSQFLAVVDFAQQLLTLCAGTGQNNGTVVGAGFIGELFQSSVIPICGVFGILIDAVTQCGNQNIAVIGEQHIVAAGNEADICAAGAERLAHSGIAGAHGHVDILNIIALFQQLFLQQGFQRLGSSQNGVGIRVGGERNVQRFHGSGGFRVRSCFCVGSVRTAAGQKAQRQCCSAGECNVFFVHEMILLPNSPAVIKKACVSQHMLPRFPAGCCLTARNVRLMGRSVLSGTLSATEHGLPRNPVSNHSDSLMRCQGAPPFIASQNLQNRIIVL